MIDEVAIYSRSLSADEIAAIFNAGSVGKCTITLDLIPPEYSFCGSVSINGYVGELDGIITQLSWDWNDGTVADSWFPASHSYRANGSYTVMVTAFCSTGETKGTSAIVNITNSEDPLCNYGLMVYPSTLILRRGKTSETLRVELRDADGVPVSLNDEDVSFSSSNPAIVQVDDSGMVHSKASARHKSL